MKFEKFEKKFYSKISKICSTAFMHINHLCQVLWEKNCRTSDLQKKIKNKNSRKICKSKILKNCSTVLLHSGTEITCAKCRKNLRKIVGEIAIWKKFDTQAQTSRPTDITSRMNKLLFFVCSVRYIKPMLYIKLPVQMYALSLITTVVTVFT